MSELHVNIESFPINKGELHDSPRIQRALDYCTLHGIGKLKAKGEYILGSSLHLPSNIIIEGVSPIHTKFWVEEGVTAFDVDEKRNISLKDFAIDGAGRNGTKAFNSYGESITIVFDNIWIDSVEIGIETEYTYFINIKNVRTMGTPVPYLFRNSTNVINMENCSSVVPPSLPNIEYSGFAITAFNGSCLSIKGCAFEGEGGRVFAFSWNGLSLDAVYHENQSGIQGDSYVFLGNGVGNPVRGVHITACNFVGGFRTAISFLSVEGVSIHGNTIHTDEAGFEFYQHDNSPKKDINIGQNSYKSGITKVIYSGGERDTSLNTNNATEQLTPLNFQKQRKPSPSHLENGDITIFNDGDGSLRAQRKDDEGQITTMPIMTGKTGNILLPAGVNSIDVQHLLGMTPDIVLCTPSSDIGNWWIEYKNEWSFKLFCYKAPSVDTTISWFVNKL